MKKVEADEPYLWSGSGEPDSEVARLEAILEPLRHRGTVPALPARPRGLTARIMMWRLPAVWTAAALLLLVAAWWLVSGIQGTRWSVQSVAGAPVISRPGAGAPMGDTARLAVGEWLVTDGVSRARVEVERVGRVDVGPNTRLQLVESRRREHRMSLVRGTIHARIWAPPELFFVDTPSGVAVDLGCEYTLQVDDGGTGLVRVTFGWVEFQSEGRHRQSFVPEGAMCATRPGVGPGTPRYEDAPSGYGEALDVLDFGRLGDPRRAAAFDLILTSARRRDALTLWHLLTRGTLDERARVYDRLDALAPPPPGVTRAKVLAGDRPSLDQWWDALGYDTANWWKIWKSKKKKL
jgi:hypothetical protein